MTPIQIMALIVAVFGSIKILIILMNPKTWLNNVVKPIYRHPGIATIAGLIIAGASLWYLLQYMTIVHVFAALLFTMALLLVGFVAFPKEMITLAEKVLDKNCLKRGWLITAIWVVLLIWVFYAIFFA